MMGSTASMVLPDRRSDLLPTRMMGSLGTSAWLPRTGSHWSSVPLLLPAKVLLITWAPSQFSHSPVESTWFGSERQKPGHEGRLPTQPQVPTRSLHQAQGEEGSLRPTEAGKREHIESRALSSLSSYNPPPPKDRKSVV